MNTPAGRMSNPPAVLAERFDKTADFVKVSGTKRIATDSNMRNIQATRTGGALVLLLAFTLQLTAATPPPGTKERFTAWAKRMKSDLQTKVFPYWYDTAIDHENGGYLLADSKDGRGQATDKMLVTQARMVWGFSHAHIKGLEDPQRNYVEAARLGYQFIRDHFYDTANGGYFMSTDLKGNPIDRQKTLYAQAFVIYAFLEYHKASADPRPRNEAIELFKLLQKKAHDDRNNGWFEHFEEDWTLVTEPTPGPYTIEIPGLKSANAHLHWMEALTALYKEDPEPQVKQALAEAIEINQRYFYPKDPTKSAFHRHFDWRPVSAFSSQGISYGHNVEFAWLMINAQRALGRTPSWDHFYAEVDFTLRHGFDQERGGVYERGYGDQPAGRTNKVWWVQAEMIAALTDAIRNHVRPDYGQALERMNNFVWRYMVDPRTGVWYDTVAADGTVVNGTEASNWKANYHDVRAMVKFYETFELNDSLMLSWPLDARPDNVTP